MLTYDQWLDSPSYDTWEQLPDGDIRIISITNRMIMSVAIKPDGWLNPFELTEQDIDKMRVEFKGGSLKWSQYVESKLPNLCPKKERKLKLEIERDKRIKYCGKLSTRLGKDGLLHTFTHKCHICVKCHAEREQQHFERLMKLDGCQVVFDDRKATVSTYGADNDTYSFTLQDGRVATVVKSDKKIEGAVEMTYELAQQLKHIQVSGTKVSGKLGIEVKPVETQEHETVFVISHIIEAESEVITKAQIEFYKQTKDLQPESVQDLKRIIIYLNNLWLKIIQKYCDKIHLLNKHVIHITELDLDWSERREYIERWIKTKESRQRIPI